MKVSSSSDLLTRSSYTLPLQSGDIFGISGTDAEIEIKLLSNYSQKIADVFDDYWSVDYCNAKDGTWYLIDMAEGDKSWRPDIKLPEENTEIDFTYTERNIGISKESYLLTNNDEKFNYYNHYINNGKPTNMAQGLTVIKEGMEEFDEEDEFY